MADNEQSSRTKMTTAMHDLMMIEVDAGKIIKHLPLN